MAKEADIVKAIRRAIEAYGGYCQKNHGDGLSSGRPDIEACVDGHFVAIEVKMPGKKATDIQTHILDKIRSAGGWAVVLDDVIKLRAGLSTFPLTCRACFAPLKPPFCQCKTS